MNAKALTLALALILLVAAPVSAKKTYHLIWVQTVGDRIEVTEESRTQTVWKTAAPGSWAAQGSTIETKHREYAEDVVEHAETDDKVAQRRLYLVATIDKRKVGAEPKPVPTSLNGKTVHVGWKDRQRIAYAPPETGVKEDDLDDTRFDRIIYAVLPDGSVAVGDSWQVDPAEFGRSVFGPAYDPVNYTVDGKARLKRVKTVKKQEVAFVELAIHAEKQPQLGSPGLKIQLAGTLQFAVDVGKVLNYELTGPITFTVLGDGEDERRTSSAEGEMVMAYKADLLEIRPSEHLQDPDAR